ncbi:MAG: diphthine--ammonia ligase [Candidatus Bathyarchaeota archaeon]|nr:diphthine--ammonia ligase [Candidatus Bathyarchaeota archaeon]MDH5596352.1 diphthine--ammonia ligase [Candidatus Bathyarchaeota archaeon]
MSRVIASLSGGKDSMYAIFLAIQEGLDIDYLMFITNGSKAHRVNRWLLKLVSESLEIPAVITGKEIHDIRRVLKKLNADIFISGVMITQEHMDWYQEICNPIQVKHYAPLWGKNPFATLIEMKELGFQILIIEVDVSMGSRESWLGKKLDNNVLQEINKLEEAQKLHPSGELGEYHTFVLDCPLYKKRINILDSEIVWENSKGYVVIKNANLQSKTNCRT